MTDTPTREQLIEKAVKASFSRDDLFGMTKRQATRVVDALAVDKLHEYVWLLEHGWSSYEARAKVWTDD